MIQDEKLLDAINRQRGGPRRWGEIAAIFPDRTRKATEVHGMKLLRRVYGTTSTEFLDLVPSTIGNEPSRSLRPMKVSVKPQQKWLPEEDEKIHHILQNIHVSAGAGWENYLHEFDNRTPQELQARAEMLHRRSQSGPLDGLNDDDDENYLDESFDLSQAGKQQPLLLPWSKEEDELLESLMKQLPEGAGRWENVVKMFPDRTRRAVISHARRLIQKRKPTDEVDPEVEKSLTKFAESAALENSLLSAGGDDDEEEKELFKVKTLWTFLEV